MQRGGGPPKGFPQGHGPLVAPEPTGDSRRKGKQLDRKDPRLQGSEAVCRVGSAYGGMGRRMSARLTAVAPSIKGGSIRIPMGIILPRHLSTLCACMVTQIATWGHRLRSNAHLGVPPRSPPPRNLRQAVL